jgi:hypothetical protein
MVMIKTLLDRGFGNDIACRRRFRRAAAGPVMLCLAVLAALPCQAQGTVQIDGRADGMRVRLENAPIAQVLADLGRRFGLTYRRVPSIDRPLTGRYSGTLNQVLARVLDGTDYILEVSDQRVTLVVLGVSAPAARIGSNPVVSTVQQEPTPPSAAPLDRAPPPAASASPSAAQVPPLSSFLPGNAQRPARR